MPWKFKLQGFHHLNFYIAALQYLELRFVFFLKRPWAPWPYLAFRRPWKQNAVPRERSEQKRIILGYLRWNTMLSMSLDTPVILHIVYFIMFVSRFPSWSADFFHLWTYEPAGFQWDPDPKEWPAWGEKPRRSSCRMISQSSFKKNISSDVLSAPKMCKLQDPWGSKLLLLWKISTTGSTRDVLGAIFFWRRELSWWVFFQIFCWHRYDNCHSPHKTGTVAGECFIGASVLVLQRV